MTTKNPFLQSLTTSRPELDLGTSSRGKYVRLSPFQPKHSGTIDNLLKATSLAIKSDYPILPVKNIEQTKFRFNLDGIEYVLLATWNDWAPYCFKEDAFLNSTIEKINDPKDKKRKDFIHKNLETKVEKHVYMEVKPITIPDGKFFIILEELYYMINKLLQKYGPESEIYTLDMLKLLYGFPLNHETSKWWSFVLIPINCIVRPALDKNPNEPVKQKFNYSKTINPNNYHEKWLKKWYEYMKTEYEKIKTKYESNIDNPEVIKKLHVYPWTGNGYTLNWKNIYENIDLNDVDIYSEIYGATEFITRSPELDKLTPDELQKDINIYQEKYFIKGYTVYNCLINNIDLLIYNIETNSNKLESNSNIVEIFFGAKYCEINADKPTNDLIIYKGSKGVLWCVGLDEIKYNETKNQYYHTIGNKDHIISGEIINRYKYTRKLPTTASNPIFSFFKMFQ
jgi:hypothetical protein